MEKQALKARKKARFCLASSRSVVFHRQKLRTAVPLFQGSLQDEDGKGGQTSESYELHVNRMPLGLSPLRNVSRSHKSP